MQEGVKPMSDAEPSRDIDHERGINFEIAAALVAKAGLTENQAKRVVEMMARRELPCVRISYL